MSRHKKCPVTKKCPVPICYFINRSISSTNAYIILKLQISFQYHCTSYHTLFYDSDLYFDKIISLFIRLFFKKRDVLWEHLRRAGGGRAGGGRRPLACPAYYFYTVEDIDTKLGIHDHQHMILCAPKKEVTPYLFSRVIPLFIRPFFKNGTYYGLVMSVRSSRSPFGFSSLFFYNHALRY